jgi:4-amino-4-deoxy-L-arabinose transferase-like glycosyltransferase
LPNYRTQRWDILGTLFVCLIAAISRFWALGRPNSLVFDEIFYVRDAFTLWRLGFEAVWPENSAAQFDAGQIYSYLPEAAFVAHPPVGKWLIAVGMMLGGPSHPWAWRLASAVIGVAAVLLVIRTARRLFNSVAMG